jgi:hypothetical protein
LDLVISKDYDEQFKTKMYFRKKFKVKMAIVRGIAHMGSVIIFVAKKCNFTELVFFINVNVSL